MSTEQKTEQSFEQPSVHQDELFIADESQPPKTKPVYYITFGLCLTLTAVVLLISLGLALTDLLEKRVVLIQEKQQSLVDQLKTDLAYAQALPFANLLSQVPTQNANDLLKTWVLWSSESTKVQTRSSPKTDGPTRKEFLAACSKWPECYSDFLKKYPTAPATLANLPQVLSFDHWILETSNTASDQAFGSLSSQPQFDQLQTALESQALYAIASGEIGQIQDSLRIFRHVSALLFSTQDLTAASAAVTLLEGERTLYNYLVETVGLDPALWTPIEPAHLQALGRLAKNLRVLFSPSSDPALMSNLIEVDSQRLFVCAAAANQVTPLSASLRASAEAQLPGEYDLRPYYQVLDQLLVEDSRCHRPYEKQLLTSGPEQKPKLAWPNKLLTRVPWMRKAITLRLLSTT